MLFSRRQTSRRDRNFLRGFNNQRLQRHLMPEALESRCMLSASAGLLDPTFGLGGIVTQDLYPNTSANSFTFESGRAIDSYQLDGETKTVVAGKVTDLVIESYFPEGSDEEQFNFIDTHDVLVARYNEDGSFDASFGTGGVTRIDFGDAVDEANCLAVDSQGRIIIGGRSGDEMVVARLLPAGALDSTFGTAGIQVVEFDGASSAAAYDLAVDASDRVVLAGIEIRQGRQSLAAARILPDSGELDPSFGVDGTQSIDIGGHGTSNAESLTIDHLGRIVLAGTHRSGIGSPNPNDFAVTRLTANGLLDSTFGLDADGDRIRDGWTFIDFNATDDQAYGIGVDALNRVIVGGTTQENGIDFAVSRLTASGELDTSFGLDGKQTIAVEGHANL